MSFTQLLRILRGRAKWVVMALLLGGAAALLITELTPAQYTAQAALLVSLPNGGGQTNAAMPAELYSGYMATQLDLMTSQEVATRALKDLNVSGNANTKRRQRLENAMGGPISNAVGSVRGFFSNLFSSGKAANEPDAGSADQLLADRLRRGVRAANGTNSSVVNLGFTSSDPEISRDVVNAFVKAYLTTSLALSVGPAKNHAQWFDDQTKGLAQNVESAQSDLSNYQQKHDIVTSNDQLDTEMSRLQELSAQLTAAQTKTYDLKSKQQEIQHFLTAGGDAGLIPDVLANPMVQGLREKIAEQQSTLMDLRGKVGPNHPVYKAAVAELASLKRHLRQEIQTVGQSVNASLAAAKAQEKSLSNASAQQRARVLSLRRSRSQLDLLKSKVQNAQNVYDEAMKNMSQARMASRSTNTNVSLVSAAVVPARPSGPSLAKNLGLGLAVGFIFGIGIALGRELQDRRIRAKEDLRDGLGIPVLAVVDMVAGRRRATNARALGGRRLRLSVDG